MVMTEERTLIAHQPGDPLCDWCDSAVPITRAEARLIRTVFGPVWCESCAPVNNYHNALRDIRSDVRAADPGDEDNTNDDSDPDIDPDQL